MTSFLSIFQLIVSLLPLVAQSVQQVENLLPASGNGSQKLELVKGLVADAYQAAPGVTATIGQVHDIVTAITSRVVAFFNAVGIFKKSAPAAVAAPGS